MPKTARHLEKGFYHITVFSYLHCPAFRSDEDKERYIGYIHLYRERLKIPVLAYLVLDGSAHLILEETGGEIVSEYMKRIGISYSRWFRRRYAVGDRPVFRGRFRSTRISGPAELLQEIELLHDPVPGDQERRKWSSYREYMMMEPRLDIEKVLDLIRISRREVHDGQGGQPMVLAEPEERFVYTDEEVRRMLELSMAADGFVDPEEALLAAVRRLKRLPGTSLRQIARVSGLSKSKVDRLR